MKTQPAPRVIVRTVATGFLAVSVAALTMGLVLIGTIFDVSRLVSGMQHDETSIRQGLVLATSVREQSLSASRLIASGDFAHLVRYRKQRERTRELLQQVAADVPPAHRRHLDALTEKTDRFHALLTSSISPALQKGESDLVQQEARSLQELETEIAREADALALSLEGKMAHAHHLATDSTRLGLIAGVAGLLFIFGLSVFFTLRLRGALLRPLDVLTERLIQSERMAAIGQLAAGVAHELNNPIGIIRGYLKTMSPDDPKESLREELAILDEEASHCQRIAEDLLAYARPEDLRLENVELDQLIEQTVQRTVGTDPKVRTTVEIEPERLVADPARLRQVFLNLILNGVQHGEQITVSGAREGHHYRLQFSDDGPGIPLEERERIFEPFFSKRRGGSGLGLSVALGIVRAHGGTITVRESTLGGALFEVKLPLSRSPEASSRKVGGTR